MQESFATHIPVSSLFKIRFFVAGQGFECELVHFPDVVQVRLVGGGTPYSGQVQVRFNSQWGAICGYYWDIEEANVVCRMLNYGRALAAFSHYSKTSSKFWLNGVRCSGMETSIAMCDHWGWGKRLCPKDHDVGVICEGPTRKYDSKYTCLTSLYSIINYPLSFIHHDSLLPLISSITYYPSSIIRC